VSGLNDVGKTNSLVTVYTRLTLISTTSDMTKIGLRTLECFRRARVQHGSHSAKPHFK
jgi:hypothetical protein